MLTEDYIMRMINQALAVFMAALGLKKAGKYREALQSFGEAKEILLGLNSHLADLLDEAALIDRLTSYDRFDIERSKLLADIYYEEGETFAFQGDEDNSKFKYQRSLRLYLESALSSGEIFDVETIQKIEATRKKLPVSSIGEYACLALLDYFDRLLSSDDEFLISLGLSQTSLKAEYTEISAHCGVD